MTHLSDYSYLDRLIPNILLLICIVFFCFRVRNAAADLTISAMKKGKLQGLILAMYLFALVFVICYDILATTIKYAEGFVDTCVTVNTSVPLDSPFWEVDGCHLYPVQESCRGIITKPSTEFSELSLKLLAPTDMLWNLACTVRNSALFMLLAYFNSTVKNMFPKPVMARWEVKIFAGYSVFSLFLYFFLQIIFSYDSLYSTVAPQILYSVECTIGGIMLLLTNRRINSMAKKQQNTANNRTGGGASLGRTLVYIKTMNTLLAMSVFMDAFGLGSINLDIILRTPDGKFLRVIYNSKLLTDIFTRIFNIGYVLTPLFAIAVIYRPTSIIGVDNTLAQSVAPNASTGGYAPQSYTATTSSSPYTPVMTMSPRNNSAVHAVPANIKSAGNGGMCDSPLAVDSSWFSPSSQDGKEESTIVAVTDDDTDATFAAAAAATDVTSNARRRPGTTELG